MSRRLDPDEPAAEVAGPPVGGIIGPPGVWPAGGGRGRRWGQRLGMGAGGRGGGWLARQR